MELGHGSKSVKLLVEVHPEAAVPGTGELAKWFCFIIF